MEFENDTASSPDFDSDDSDATSPPTPDGTLPQKVADARVAQEKDGFDSWLRDNREERYKLSYKKAMDSTKKAPPTSDWVDDEDAPIISSPREYQTELFERAKKKNIIAVLDTGTGKTLIAALLLRYTVEKELDDRRDGKPHRLAFFLVDKVALVHQQYRVLQANLDFSMDSFSGDSSGGILVHEFWEKTLAEKTIIVCTAEILHQCLRHSFVRMDQINLLIFDEAHHAKKNHPYARIIKDFFAPLEENRQERPRILGMTASPVDAKTNMYIAAAQLEGLLHCEITTIDDAAAFAKAAISKPTEGFIEYWNRNGPLETELWRHMHRLVGDNQGFSRLFTYSKECTSELGRWAADRVWQLWLTKDKAVWIEARTERDFNVARSSEPISVLDARRKAVRQAREMILNHPFPKLEVDWSGLSDKVLKLVEHLRDHFDPERDKCVIFAEQRLTVALLADIFSQPILSLRGYRAGKLMGSSSGTSGDLGMTLAEQYKTIRKFRKGHLNCLFATSAGEEGIDIPDCNLVIRFDLYKTVIQYIQSRGRARRADSKFYQMIESGNHAHRRMTEEVQEHETRLREYYSSLPEDRLITGCDYDIDYHLSRERGLQVYKVPSTGALLTYKSSIAVLANFVSTLPHPPDVCLTADYIIHSVGAEFESEVLLPDSSPIRSAIGRRATSKQIAKCSAAFEMCKKLRVQGHLDDHLRSTFSERLPKMRNARLAISSKKQTAYPMKLKPSLWATLGVPQTLFVTVIRLSVPEALGRPSRPLALLTRQVLPPVAKCPIYFCYDQMSEVDCYPLPGRIECVPWETEALTHFTLKIFKDIFSKEYVPEAEKMPYFIAPLVCAHNSEQISTCADPRAVIDWSCLKTVQSHGNCIEWEGQPEQVFDDRFVTDPYDGSRKFYTGRRRPDLKSTDPQLPGMPISTRQRRDIKGSSPDIWNSCVSIWGKSRRALVRREDLTVVEAEFLPHRQNLFDKFEIQGEATQKCFLVFQTLKISPLPVEVVAMAYNLPAIIYRLESSLITLEACKAMGFEIRPDLALEAMTKDSANTEEHSVEQLNQQLGMGNNYERLEFLGDSFLKMSTTIALFTRIPESDEFQYHVDRMVLICNKNLFNNALELKLEESIRTQGFSRRIWYPLGLTLLKGKRNDADIGMHVLGDKSIADVCEALIGAAYLTTLEEKNFDMAIQAVTKFVNHDNHRMTRYSDYYAAYKIPSWQSAESRAVQHDLALRIEEKMGYKFKYPRLLRSAFTHPSYSVLYEGIPNYQRLEFLGDALLDMAIVDHLYHAFPGADPQWLTEHKMAMVSNQFLGCLCVTLGLHKHLVALSPAVGKEVDEYATDIMNARLLAEEKAEAAGLGRDAYSRNYWVEEKKPPKCLPDIVEAYVGAVFVDSEYSYDEVLRFFHTHVMPFFQDIHLYDTYANNHPVTLLSNTLATKLHCRQWRIMCSETDHEDLAYSQTKVAAGVVIHGQVWESAYADSGRYAKMKAAKNLLRKMNDMEIEEFREKFNCNCPPIA
ncbi:hypothetical protein F5Y17DRAFT_456050 [Xylariaceae sp. FL0594]|nr:hypothetical protein F5Y17DRAFT_456050 [Xylariaceae sp. FL0594]